MIMTNSRINRNSIFRSKLLLQGFLILIMAFFFISIASAWTCAYVSSYHKGYAWSDGIERGLRAELNGHCDIIQFDMDTMRNKDELYKIQKAQAIATDIKRIMLIDLLIRY